MKKILSFALALLMVVSVLVLPTTVSAADAEKTIYSWNGFIDGDIRTIKADAGQVVDLGFVGAIAKAPVVDGSIDDGEYSKTQTIPLQTDASKSVEAHYAVYGDYLYIAVNTSKSGVAPTTRSKIQYDIGVAGSGSGEATWNRLGIAIGADGVMEAIRSPFAHDTGASAYASTLAAVYNSDYCKEYAFDFGVYEAKFDLGQLFRLFSNLPGGQDGWESPTVNFSFWLLTGGERHFDFPHEFRTETGRSGGWVSATIIIPEETLANLRAKYKGVIGALGEDYRNAVPGQLITVKDYATVTPVIDGKVSEGEYTTTGKYTTLATYAGDITANYSVKDGYLYAAFSYKYKPTPTSGTLIHFGTFAAVNSSFMLHSRAQTTFTASANATDANWGNWSGSQGGMWKTANGPADSKWHSTELGAGAGAGTVFKAAKTAYDEAAGVTTIEVQISIPSLLAILDYEGYNAEEANAIQFMFWPDASKATAYMAIDGTTATNIYRKSGYGYGLGNVLPTVELPKGCAELYHVEDVDDLGAFGQNITEARPSTATPDGKISAGEYTASHAFKSTDFVDYISGKKDFKYDIKMTDYYAYDADYFYLGAQVYDPYYKEGSSAYQLNISVLDKNDPYTVVNNYDSTVYKVVRNNFIDVGDAITRASWTHTLYNDRVSVGSKPGCVIRTQQYTSGSAASDVQSAFTANAHTFAEAGYEFGGSYDANTKIYTYEAKIPLAELKHLFGVDEIESINYYCLYKFTTPDTAQTDYAQSYNLQTSDAGWQALRSLTMASWASVPTDTITFNRKTTPYNVPQLVNVVKLVDAPITKDSASARISNTVSGLRFKSVFTNDYLAYMAKYAEEKGLTMEVGTIIAPADYITGEFTHAALGNGKYVDVMADLATPFAKANGVTTIAGSLVNIKEANLDRDFAGRGFIKIGNEYFYAETYTVKNVSDIATAALADTKTAQSGAYQYKVSEGVWSPYSEGQRIVLDSLVASK